MKLICIWLQISYPAGIYSSVIVDEIIPNGTTSQTLGWDIGEESQIKEMVMKKLKHSDSHQRVLFTR